MSLRTSRESVQIVIINKLQKSSEIRETNLLSLINLSLAHVTIALL
jgi:hypothetical protein